MKEITIDYNGEKKDLIARMDRYYLDDTLAIQLFERYYDEKYDCEVEEPFGTLTVNMDDPHQDDTHAFVKAYGENKSWAEAAATALGGKPTGIWMPAGYVEVQLWEFPNFFN